MPFSAGGTTVVSSVQHEIRFLEQEDVELLIGLLDSFENAPERSGAQSTARPSRTYLRRLLGQSQVIALVARSQEKVVGGLVAYIFEHVQHERSEIYVYNLAVNASHRRLGIATALMDRLCSIARKRGAHLVIMHASLEDAPVVSLLTKLGTCKDVLRFQMSSKGGDSTPTTAPTRT